MKNIIITEKDMRLPEYEGFIMDFVSEKELFNNLDGKRD